MYGPEGPSAFTWSVWPLRTPEGCLETTFDPLPSASAPPSPQVRLYLESCSIDETLESEVSWSSWSFSTKASRKPPAQLEKPYLIYGASEPQSQAAGENHTVTQATSSSTYTRTHTLKHTRTLTHARLLTYTRTHGQTHTDVCAHIDTH